MPMVLSPSQAAFSLVADLMASSGVRPAIRSVRKAQIASADGGQPGRKGTLVAVQTTGWNAGKWYDVGVEHGEAIVKGTSRSVVTYNNSSANYSKWAAGSFSADSADMRATLSWNYQLTTAVTPAWLN